MIEPEPVWIYFPSALPNVTIWECEAHLLGDYVLGVLNQSVWFCLDRMTGEVKWERNIRGRPNTISGLFGDVIVATEFRANDGPWAASFGVYGLGLDDLKLRWTAHAPGAWNRVVRALDFVPGFTNELRQAPLAVRHDQVLTNRGRVLDVLTGRDLGAIDITPQLEHEVTSPTTHLRFDKQAACADGGTLHSGTPDEPEEIGVVESDSPVRFTKRDAQGAVSWIFDAAHNPGIQESEQWRLNYHFLDPYIYLAVAGSPVDHEDAEPRLTFSLWSLDVRSGQVVQQAPLPAPKSVDKPACEIESHDSCDIEDADSRNLLVSRTGCYGSLALFARAQEQ